MNDLRMPPSPTAKEGQNKAIDTTVKQASAGAVALRVESLNRELGMKKKSWKYYTRN